MGLTVTTPSVTRLLTTVARVKTELGITSSSDDSFLDSAVRQSGDMAETFCGRIFPRQKYTETAASYGGPFLPLAQAPVVSLTSSAFDGDTFTDISVSDVVQGLLYRESGFQWTAQRYSGLLATGSFFSGGIPVNLSEERLWSFVYFGGYIVPTQNLLSVTTVSVDDADNSFNDSASGFPSMLKSGDIIETSGFTNAANNGRFVVSGTPTTAKIVVVATLVDENAAAGRTVLVSNLPGDVERGVIEIVKSIYAKRSVDGSIIERQAGPLRIRHSEGSATEALGIPPSAVGLLRPWIRSVA